MSRPLPGCCWLLLTLLISGCVAVGRSPAPLNYRLELERTAVPQPAPVGGILRIAQPDAVASVNTRGIAYRTQPHQLSYYTRSRWTDTPARMLGTVLTDAFDTAGLFRAVVDDGTVPADYLLTTQLLRLEQHLPPGGEASVQIRLRLQLIELPQRRLLVSRLIEANAPSPRRNAEGAVAAAHAALTDVVDEAVRSVHEALTAAPVGPPR